jgi:hypothetical protein
MAMTEIADERTAKERTLGCPDFGKHHCKPDHRQDQRHWTKGHIADDALN